MNKNIQRDFQICISVPLRNKKKLMFKNRLKDLKRKCFSVFRQKQSSLYGVKDGCKKLQRFSFKLLKPFCLSSEQGFNNTIVTRNGKFSYDHDNTSCSEFSLNCKQHSKTRKELSLN